jgi:4-hydroxybenzoate polyprenyltransferase
VTLLRSIGVTLEMIKWEHSVFALPFALSGAMLAADGWPSVHQLTWIIVAMVAARSAAMAFNRLADHQIDAANPRTRARALPAGLLTRRFVAVFVILSCAILVLAAAQLNRLALILSPVVLAILLLYSYTKRFTRWSHLILGLSLGMAPAAAWVAVRGSLDSRILLLTGAVTLWVAGFDVLYSCQDYEVDCRSSLHSLPKSYGIAPALTIARLLHAGTLAFLGAAVYAFDLGAWAVLGLIVVALLLAYEHSLVSPQDLSRLNAAFFTMNGVISVVFFVFLAADLLLEG